MTLKSDWITQRITSMCFHEHILQHVPDSAGLSCDKVSFVGLK